MAGKNGLGKTDLCVEVKSGDSVWKLAERIYGPGQAHLAAIYEENHMTPQVIARNGKRAFLPPVVKPGDKLYFPAPERVAQLDNDFFKNIDAGKSRAMRASGSSANESACNTHAAVSRAEKPSESNLTPKVGSGVSVEWQHKITSNATKLTPELAAPTTAPLEKITTPPDIKPTDSKTNLSAGGSDVLTLPPALKASLKTSPASDISPIPGNAQASVGNQVLAPYPVPSAGGDNLTRVAHVAEVCADGLLVGTIKEGIKQSCEDPLGTAARVGTAVALGTAFGVATGGVGFAAEAIGAVGVGLTVAGAWDFLNPYDKRNAERNAKIATTATQAWNAQDRQAVESCYPAMEHELGRPGFDIGIGIIGGAAGAKFGSGVIRPRIDQFGTPALEVNPKLLTGPSNGSPTSIETSQGGLRVLDTTHGGPKWVETTKGGGGAKLLEDRQAKANAVDTADTVDTETVEPFSEPPQNPSRVVENAENTSKSPSNDSARQKSTWEEHKRKLGARLGTAESA